MENSAFFQIRFIEADSGAQQRSNVNDEMSIILVLVKKEQNAGSEHPMKRVRGSKLAAHAQDPAGSTGFDINELLPKNGAQVEFSCASFLPSNRVKPDCLLPDPQG